MLDKKFKGMSVAKGFSSELTGMKEKPNKYDDPDNMKSTTDEEKASVKSMNKQFRCRVPLLRSGYNQRYWMYWKGVQ